MTIFDYSPKWQTGGFKTTVHKRTTWATSLAGNHVPANNCPRAHAIFFKPYYPLHTSTVASIFGSNSHNCVSTDHFLSRSKLRTAPAHISLSRVVHCTLVLPLLTRVRVRSSTKGFAGKIHSSSVPSQLYETETGEHFCLINDLNYCPNYWSLSLIISPLSGYRANYHL